MGDDTRDGAPFADAQRAVLELRKRGVLLGLCSKNNAADVDAVLESHPDMLLRDTDFAIKRVNWQDKATNLRSIAEELNIGLDALVFVDDSEFELNLVRDQLPQVQVLQVPRELHRYPALLREAHALFFNLSTSAEDTAKTEMYRQEASRRAAAQKFANLDEYLASLDLRIGIRVGDRAQVPRIAQMTQKTNQFNLTTQRYTEADIARMLDDSASLVASFTVSDRFGDYGVTGLAIVAVGATSGEATLDTLLMSCRVLGRNVERAFFDQLIALLRGRGVHTLNARWLRSAKNALVENLCESLGFTVTQVEADGKRYTLQLSAHQPGAIGHVAVDVKIGTEVDAG
jgi:FkbH-like protein